MTPKERYGPMMDALQMIGRRNMLCGMHVHVELPDPERRIEIMARITPDLPLLLALSTSSPFWQSCRTGLKGYRLAAYDELPRTGLPELFRTAGEYEAYVAAMVRSGAMDDSSHVWWAIRPSRKYPTLELRAPDCCTRLDDALAIAALYRAMVRNLYFDPGCNAEVSAVSRALAVENKWRAQRYGVQGSFVTEAGAVSVADRLEQVLARLADDVRILGCEAEAAHCRAIVAGGTSADRQLAVYEEHSAAGQEAALRAVTAWVVAATLSGDEETDRSLPCAAGSPIGVRRSPWNTM
jgi:carboxylate-amine ligase